MNFLTKRLLIVGAGVALGYLGAAWLNDYALEEYLRALGYSWLTLGLVYFDSKISPDKEN